MGATAKSSLGRLGPYELLQKLATGGMSEVYEARRKGAHGFSKRIALKRILPQLVADPELVAMFVDEAQLASQLSHPNLVQVFDFGEEEGELYMTMELVKGTTCAKLVRELSTRNETVPTDLALYIGLSIARGLEHAHEACDERGRPLRLVHRDISPGNVLLSGSGAVKLSDFGIARAAFLERRTEHGQLKGKLGYMSPEQVLGRELDDKADQFSAGIVVAEMLIGRPLFGGGRDIDILVRIRDADVSNIARYGAHITEDVRAVLLRALSRRAEDRFPTTRGFVEAIEDVMRRGGWVVRPAQLAAYLERKGFGDGSRRSDAPGGDDLSKSRNGPSLARTEPCDPPRPRAYAALPPSLLRVAEPLRHSQDEDPPSYRVKLDWGEVGPLPITEVAKLFATAEASRETPIARDDANEANEISFAPAHELPELSRLCSASKWRWEEDLAEAPSERFTIVRREWPERLVASMLAQKTGVFIVRQGSRETRVFLVDGILQAAVSTEPRDLLGSMLVASGAATLSDVERAVALSLEHGGRMGDALVALGTLRPMALCRALVMQTRRRFIDLLRWSAGEATFLPGARSYEEDRMPDRVPPFDLVAQGIREGYSAAELAEIVEPLLDGTIAPATQPKIGVASLRLTRAESAVFDRIDGLLRVSDLVERCIRENVATNEEVYRALFIGFSMKILRVLV